MKLKKIIEEIDSIIERDPAAGSRLGVVFLYPSFHVMIFYKIANIFWRYNLKFISRLLMQLARMLTGIEIHPAAKIGHNFFMDHGLGIVIGETAEVGENVTIYQGVTLGGVMPSIESDAQRNQKRHPTIGNHVIIGSGAQILGPINIGDYAHFSEIYQGEKGPLDMDYYVLKDHLDKAIVHFKDAAKMMKAFEHWFGPYPFYEDSFKLVEVPYLGMEHQSSVTYGNQYKKGYLGTDLSGTGWGLKFDFIIIHESGHEWFANNITYKDAADMWIHEGFTAYSESLFLDYYYGTKAASEYVIGTRNSIRNDKPIIGLYDVNSEGSSDMYYKGANMLHTLRQLIKDDEKWRQILRGLNSEFHHQTVTTKQIETYIIDESGLDLTAFFDQYLRDIRIPTFEYRIVDSKLSYRWTQVVDGFAMPIEIEIENEKKWLYPSKEWQEIKINSVSYTHLTLPTKRIV